MTLLSSFLKTRFTKISSTTSEEKAVVLPRPSHDPALSGLRGAASFGVVLFHASVFIPYPLSSLTSTFYLGVPIFLMMSMYLLLNRLDKNPDLKHYFARRIVRIWPIYYGSLIVFYMIFHFPFWAFIRYFFFLEYYVNPLGYFPVSIFWTLQLEEAMYLFIPIIHKFKPKIWLALAFISSGLLYLTLVSNTPSGQHPTIYFQFFLPVSLMAYGYGILAYAGKVSIRFRWMSLFAIFSYTLLNILNSRSIELGYYPNFFLSNVFVYSIALLGFASIVCNPPRFLGWLSFLGEESYALYAIHFALVTVFGLLGIIYAVAISFMIEYALRPKEINRRLRLSYSKLKS